MVFGPGPTPDGPDAHAHRPGDHRVPAGAADDPDPAADSRPGIRVRLACALLEHGRSRTDVAHVTGVPPAMVEFLDEHRSSDGAASGAYPTATPLTVSTTELRWVRRVGWLLRAAWLINAVLAVTSAVTGPRPLGQASLALTLVLTLVTVGMIGLWWARSPRTPPELDPDDADRRH